jgi:hypothetical protein
MNFTETTKRVVSTDVPVLQPFESQPYREMPKLLASGRTPLSLGGGMARRLGRVGTAADAKMLQDHYFTSANLMVRNSSGAVVVAAYEQNPFAKQVALSLNKDSVLRNGSLVDYQGMDSDELYAAVKAGGAHVEISPDKARNLNNDVYAEKSLRARVWREALAEGNKALDQEYGALVDKVTGKDFKHNRGLFVPGYEGGRLVWCGSVGDYDSLASGSRGLDSSGGALVGVGAGGAVVERAEARVVTPTLEQTLASGRTRT